VYFQQHYNSVLPERKETGDRWLGKKMLKKGLFVNGLDIGWLGELSRLSPILQCFLQVLLIGNYSRGKRLDLANHRILR